MLACDVVIIGGGIAGLWTLNRLRKQGYQAILLEKTALGFGQSIASQGIIHGGIKYSLQGTLSRSSEKISDMPAIWQDCLKQQGEINLSAVKILSDCYYLCSQQKITQSVTQFFAQKALRSHSTRLKKNTYPDFFNTDLFTGKLTQVDELVLDVPSLLYALAKPMLPFIFKIRDVFLQNHTLNMIDEENKAHPVKCNHIICTAGEGNATLSDPALMQKRPLNMVMLTADELPSLFLHCVGLNTNPVLTITSHTTPDNKPVWYLGGQLAEDGVDRDDNSQISVAFELITQQFPWFKLKNPRWKTLRIDRAEGENGGKRPESVSIVQKDNIITAWPTKLTFAPLLADKILKLLPPSSTQEDMASTIEAWPKPEIAKTPWSTLC